jgi:flagellin
MSLDQGGGTDEITFQDGTTNWAVGDRVSLGVAGKTVTYTVSASDVDSGNNTIPDLIAVGLKSKIDALGIEGLVVDYDSASPGVLSFTNDGDIDVSVTGQFKNAGSGGFALMSTIDVTSDHVLSLANIETMLDDAINAAAAFGSVQNRISIQSDFVGQLTNSMKAGIGSLIDADMEETSARLQALQVQQQLGIQALSIANQAPQSILALFR